MSRYLAEVEAIAREAGALLMQHFARRVIIEYKGDVDLVTAADRASFRGSFRRPAIRKSNSSAVSFVCTIYAMRNLIAARGASLCGGPARERRLARRRGEMKTQSLQWRIGWTR